MIFISGKFLCDICEMFDCDFGDIITYVPDKNKATEGDN